MKKTRQTQPKIRLELTWADRMVEALCALLALLLVGISLAYYPSLPKQIPQHYNAAGEVDIYGPKYLLLVIVGLGLLLYGLVSFLNQRPHWFNYPVAITPENAERQYALATRLLRMLKLMLLLLFFHLTWRTLQIALGKATALSPWLMWGILGANGLLMVWYFAQAMAVKKGR